jgi:hypothetical protein
VVRSGREEQKAHYNFVRDGLKLESVSMMFISIQKPRAAGLRIR